MAYASPSGSATSGVYCKTLIAGGAQIANYSLFSLTRISGTSASNYGNGSLLHTLVTGEVSAAVPNSKMAFGARANPTNTGADLFCAATEQFACFGNAYSTTVSGSTTAISTLDALVIAYQHNVVSGGR